MRAHEFILEYDKPRSQKQEGSGNSWITDKGEIVNVDGFETHCEALVDLDLYPIPEGFFTPDITDEIEGTAEDRGIEYSSMKDIADSGLRDYNAIVGTKLSYLAFNDGWIRMIGDSALQAEMDIPPVSNMAFNALISLIRRTYYETYYINNETFDDQNSVLRYLKQVKRK